MNFERLKKEKSISFFDFYWYKNKYRSIDMATNEYIDAVTATPWRNGTALHTKRPRIHAD